MLMPGNTEHDVLFRPKRATQKHRLLFSLLALLIVIEILTVLVVLTSQKYAADRALRAYTHELLQNVVDETRENAASYLRQAQDSVSLAAGVLQARLLSTTQADGMERYFLEQLQVLPQVDSLFFGDSDGSFVFSKRISNEPGAGFLSKIIRNGQQGRDRVTLLQRNAAFEEINIRSDPNDTFDPRQRPWFSLAQYSSEAVWTEPYIFFTSQQPGLTVARAVRDADGEVRGVIGADIELSMLSQFLRTQRIGQSGAAFIVYSDGSLLAHPTITDFAQRSADNKLRLKVLDELNGIMAKVGSRLTQRFPDLLALNFTHFDKFELHDTSYVSMFVPLLHQGDNQWIMGVYAPEDELARTIRKGQRQSIVLGIAMSLLTVTAAIVVGLIVMRPISTLQRQAHEDPLTGLLNRRSFDEIAHRRIADTGAMGEPVSAIMIDIDFFKPINDEYGHAVGDEVLLAVARRIGRGLSNHDLLSRHGGEEFAILLPALDLEAGSVVAERLRDLVASEPIKTSVGPIHVTISLGVAESTDRHGNVAELLDRADQGLLSAKRNGRNCVVAFA